MGSPGSLARRLRVFVAGAGGAIGRRLLPQLLEAGHHVVGMTRSPSTADAIRRTGAEPVVCDVFDLERLRRVVADARVDALIHQMTDLPREFDFRKLKAAYERNNRVREEGTANLVDAARAAGVGRLVVQSMASWYAPDGATLRVETDPLFVHAPDPVGRAVRALAHMEAIAQASGLEAVILRYGAFYGPGTWHGNGGGAWTAVRRRRYPIVAGGTGVYSWRHIDDAAGATVAALERAQPGLYNVADDEPAAAREWLPFYASVVGAPPPRHVPAWLVRLAAGRGLVEWERRMPGAS